MGGMAPYQLVATDYSHDGQRLNAVLLRVERLEASLTTNIAEDNVRMDFSVQVSNTLSVSPHSVGEGSDRLGVARLSAATVVSRATLRSVAVDVHIGELAILSSEVDDLVVLKVVTAVAEGYKSC